MQTAILHLWANIIFYEQDFSRLHHLWSKMATYDVDLHHAHTALLFPCRYPDCSHKCRCLPPSQLTSGELLGEPDDKGLPGFWAMSLAADEKRVLQKYYISTGLSLPPLCSNASKHMRDVCMLPNPGCKASNL